MSGPIQEKKAALRKKLLTRRRGLEKRAEKDEAIFRQVTELPLYCRAQRLFFYVNAPFEVDTRKLLRTALEAGREVYAPVSGTTGDMVFRRVWKETSLRPGRFGIWEPDPQAPQAAFPPEAGQGDLCLVPGIAFDRRGFRLGYGKGYYDRFLAEHPMTAVGLCYRELLLPELPAEKHDRNVALVATEAGCTACEGRPGPGKE